MDDLTTQNQEQQSNPSLLLNTRINSGAGLDNIYEEWRDKLVEERNRGSKL